MKLPVFELNLLIVLLSGATLLIFLLAYKIRSLQKERDRLLNETKEDAKVLFLKSRYASMGETVGNIAHQWKQPLNAIGAIQNSIKAALIFQGEISKDKLLNSVETSFKLLQHLAETIDTFYSFLSQRSNENMNFKIADELEKVRKITEYSFENSKIHLKFELESNPTIQGNSNEFTHAILNLILNAKDAFDTSSVSSPLITVHVSGGERNCTITVTDNAGGIRLKPVDIVFNLHISTKEHGSGLGLFMTKNIIEKRFGGKIDVQNTKDGACFTITLPYAEYGEYFVDTVTLEEKNSLERINQLSHKIIELEEVERALQKWADIFKKAHWAIAIHIGTSNKFESTNDAFNSLYGYTSEELRNISVPDLFPEESLHILSDVQKKAFEKGYTTFETINKRKDGSIFPASVELIVIKDEDGEILYHIANIWDLTEKKASEERLLLKKFALDHIQDAVFLIDANARFHYVNQGACNALGYTREEFERMNIGDVDPDWPRERWPEHWDVLKKAGSLTMELRHRRKDGTIFPVEVSANYIQFGDKAYNMAIARDITERLALEAEKENRAIRRITENSPDIIVRFDTHGRRTYLNPKAEELFSIDKSLLMGKTLADITPVINKEFFETNLQNVIRTGEEASFETEYIDASGKNGWADMRMVPEFDSGGTISSVLSIGRDITERKEMEELLRKKERGFRSLAENIPDNIARWDFEGRYLYINPVHERTLGISLAEAIGSYISDEHKDVLAAIVQVALTGETVSAHQQVPGKNGRTEMHDVTLVPERDESGKIISVLGIGRDMTDIYRLQDEIAARERELRALAESSPGMMGMYYMRPDGSVCMPYASSNIRELFGITPEEIKEDATPLMALTHPDDAEMVVQTIQESAQKMSLWHIEYRIIHPTKGIRWMEGNTMPQPHPDGGVVWYGYVHDITERKETEETVRLLQHSLEFSLESLFIMDADTRELRFVQVNDAACKTLGYSKEEMLCMGVVDIDPDHDVDILKAHLEELKKVQSLTFETRHQDKNGRIYPVEIRSSYFEYGDKKYILSLTIDITERKHSEEALKKALEFNEGIIAAIPDLLFEISPDGTYVGVWAQNPELLAAQREMLLGKDFKEILPPNVVITLLETLKEVDEKGHSLGKTFSLDLPVGKKWFELSVTKKKSGGNYIVLSRDITRRKELEALLDKERKFLIDAQHVAHTGSWYLDIPNNVLTWSDETYRIFELDKESVTDLHKTFYEIVHPDDREMVQAPYLETLNARLPYELEHRIVMKNGRIKYVIERCEHTYDDEGTPLYSIGTVQDITERKRMEASLHEANDRYIQILDNSTDVIYLIEVTSDGRFIYVDVNAAYEEVTGIPRDIVIGMDVEDIEDETFRSILIDKFTTCLNTEGKTDYIADYPFPIGLRTFHSVLAPIRDKSGRIVRIVGVSRDITEKKLMEKEIEDSYRFLTQIIDSIPDPIFVKDREHRWVMINEAFCTLIDRPRFMLLGQSDYDFFPKEEADVFWEKDELVFQSRDINVNEEPFTSSDGTIHYIQTVKTMFTSDSKGEHLVGTIRDITERKNAEETIKNLNTTLEKRVIDRTAQLQEAITKLHKEITERIETEKQLKLVDSAVNSTTEAIYINDYDLSILYVNDGACRMLGYTREELTSMKIIDIDANLSAEQIFEIRDEALGNNQTFFETKHRTKTGEIIDVEIVGNPFVYEGVEGVISVVKNITEKKAAQTELMEREEKFRQLFVLSPAAISITSLERNIYLEVNDSFLDHTGYTREEVVGHSSADLGIFADPQERIELFRMIADDGIVHDFRYHYRSKDGHIGYAAAYGSVIMYKGEKCYIGHSYDMSSYQQIEEMRQERLMLEERLSKLAASVPGVNYIFEKTVEGIVRFTYLAPTFEELFGLSADAAMADFSVVMEHIHPEDREMIRLSIVDTARDLTNWNEEFRIFHPQNGIVWIEGQSSPELQNDGSILWYGFFHDATERKNAEAALAQNEEMFRVIVENSPDVISRYDLQMRRIYVNPMMQFLLAKPLDEILGKTPREFSPLPDVDVFEQLFETVVRGKNEIDYEAPYISPWGEKRWGNQRIIPEFDEDRNVVGVMVIGRDFTARKMMDKQLKLIETAINNIDEAVYIVDDNRQIVYVSDAACKMLEYTKEELVGKSILDIDIYLSEQDLCQIFENVPVENRLAFDTKHKTKRGNILDIHVNTTCFVYDGIGFGISLVKEIVGEKV